MLKGLGAVDALNLDGSGSTSLVAPLSSIRLRVVKVSIHDRTPALERPVVTVVGVTSAEP